MTRTDSAAESGARTRPGLALLALALGGFGIGTTEFVIMGLLPEVAGGLGVDIPSAGHLISSYALGVVIGAPLLTALTVRLRRQPVLVGLMVLFAAGNLASALAPGYGMVMIARFVSGMPHGTFFGIGAVVASSVVAPGYRARAVSMMFLGLTVANVVGVPAGTAIGQLVGWRWTFALVAGLGALAAVAAAVLIPRDAGVAATSSSLRREFSVLRRPQVLLSLGAIVLGFGGLFACYSYVAPMMTQLGGFSPAMITPLLVVVGLGMTVGSLLGGHFADRNPLLTILTCMSGVTVALVALAMFVPVPWLAIPLLFAVGMFSLALGPAVQTRLLDQAGDAPSLVSAGLQSGSNLANSIGAWLGGLVIAAGFGFAAPNLVGAALAAAGVLLVLASAAVERRGPGRSRTSS
ncbi:MFS transporter [Saccharopolyspora sp. HNM0983]|uniref:MFS transporter n=1 Tax=Saccharopolyspora montiporae TaxID=2781240 RepID=A0A929BCX6_9PSEU|nr:MFS transporter [Saccharopolyspora sp. HNM0983]MBE9376470.1 MFS transporter [Saccharopolyspora sp. HNM0983]